MVNRSLWMYLSLGIILLAGCQKNERDDHALEKSRLANHLLLLKTHLQAAKSREEPVVEIILQDSVIQVIQLESWGSINVEKGLIIDHQVDPDKWTIDLLFYDSSTLLTWYLGTETGIGLEVKLDPFGNVPLSAIVDIVTPIKGKVGFKVAGQDGIGSEISHSLPDISRHQVLTVLGLYPQFENTVEFSFFGPDGTQRHTISRKIITGRLPEGLPSFEVVTPYLDGQRNTLFLVNFRPTNIPFMVDCFGKIRWYSIGFTKGEKFGLQRFRNGNMGYGKSGPGQGSVFEYSICGVLLDEYSFFPEFQNVHHDVYEMANGNFLIPVNKVGATTVEDYIVELDRISGTIMTVWDMNLILPKRDTLIHRTKDWIHVNAVFHDERDHTIIVSSQSQGIFKVTWDNQLKWILAPPYDWDGYQQYLLSPVGTDMDWNWGQHAPLLTPEGNLFFFDNGFGRAFGGSQQFSRAWEVHIVESEIGGMVEAIWEFGRDRAEAFFSPVMCDVDYIVSSNTRIIVSGALAFEQTYRDKYNITGTWSDDQPKAIILEVNQDKQVLFELHIKSEIENAAVYRAEKLTLY